MSDRAAVVDTTVLVNFERLGGVAPLAFLFDRLLLPGRVRAEFVREAEATLDSAAALLVAEYPSFAPCDRFDLPTFEALQQHLDPGESEALAQAMAAGLQTVLTDDAAARRVATGLGLQTTGTARLLARLHLAGIMAGGQRAFLQRVARLRRSGQRIPDSIARLAWQQERDGS
ncbi:MAG: hypothetical protein U0704_08960 [Candidatus Eisenbacteria bacterium]